MSSPIRSVGRSIQKLHIDAALSSKCRSIVGGLTANTFDAAVT
jgi:hypothetical protein